METLIIQVDCRPYLRDGGPPQLGITVEAPLSHKNLPYIQKKQHHVKTTSTNSYQNHDYQNLDSDCLEQSNYNTKYNTNNLLSSYKETKYNYVEKHTRKPLAISNKAQQVHEGLLITQIQRGSVIDRIGQFRIGDIIVEVNGVNLQRPFAEAQKTLKQFVIEHTSHGPLVLKVFRKSASSSSVPSTAGSQVTVIEREVKHQYHKAPTLDPSASPPKQEQPSNATLSLSESPTSPKSSSSRISRHLVGALNTRKIGVKHQIKLRKAATGFGIKIAERDNMHNTKNRPIYITAITTSGSAYQDGRLKEGDMLLEVNGLDLKCKTQTEVTKILKNIGVKEEVEFVVSRQENLSSDDSQEIREDLVNGPNGLRTESDCDKSLIDLDVPDQDDSVFVGSINNHQFEEKIDSILNVPIIDGPGTYMYDIPINDTKSAGLGLYLKYPRRADNRKDLGIWIDRIITGGAAWKDGRLQPDDQILAINGIDLVGLSNSKASETLTAAVCRGVGPEATLNTIRLQIHRRNPSLVDKILQGTNNRIECSDIMSTDHHVSSIMVPDNNMETFQDNYQTSFDSATQSNFNDNGHNSSSSSVHNSQNDSAISPQTQASNSLKLTNSCNEKSDQNSSDKTNETTSSAISQITDSTNHLPSNDFNLNSDSLTQPKSIHTGDDIENIQILDYKSGSHSWDDESNDAAVGEYRFQRDGFGRQSMSEKRHAQLNAKNTDTFRRNQKIRDEREQQRLLEEQLARQRLDDDDGYQQLGSNQRIPSTFHVNQYHNPTLSHPIQAAQISHVVMHSNPVQFNGNSGYQSKRYSLNSPHSSNNHFQHNNVYGTIPQHDQAISTVNTLHQHHLYQQQQQHHLHQNLVNIQQPMKQYSSLHRPHNHNNTIPSMADALPNGLVHSTPSVLQVRESMQAQPFGSNPTREDTFQRDSFGRQSMTEKRLAQMNIYSADTLRRNQRIRDERDYQRRLEEQLARQRFDALLQNNQRLPVINHARVSHHSNISHPIQAAQISNVMMHSNQIHQMSGNRLQSSGYSMTNSPASENQFQANVYGTVPNFNQNNHQHVHPQQQHHLQQNPNLLKFQQPMQQSSSFNQFFNNGCALIPTMTGNTSNGLAHNTSSAAQVQNRFQAHPFNTNHHPATLHNNHHHTQHIYYYDF